MPPNDPKRAHPKPTQQLHELGQSLWLDAITRTLLDNGTLEGYIADLSVTGLTSNPTIFDHAFSTGSAYDSAISERLRTGSTGEALFFDLALDDITRAAYLFAPVHERTNHVDGWVSLEVSPLIAHDAALTLEAARSLSERAQLKNLLIKIPGTKEGLIAAEEAIFAGIAVNITLLFSREHYLAAAEAYLRAIERRMAIGLNPEVGSVASVFVSRWDVAVEDKVAPELDNLLGTAMAGRIYKAYMDLRSAARWTRIYNAGAKPQRLLWASTGTKDPDAADTMYIAALASPFTVNTVPEKTLLAFADHGTVGPAMAADGGECERLLERFDEPGLILGDMADRLQEEGTRSFVKSWKDLLEVIARKSAAIEHSPNRPLERQGDS